MQDTHHSIDTLVAFASTLALAQTLNRLCEIAIRTEDEKLKKALNILTNLISAMQVDRNTEIRLNRIDGDRYPDIKKTVLAIAQYCEKVRDSGHKEWEILASRAGWHPPRG